MIRDTGDFTVTAGKTSWLPHDVYFDTPDPDTGPAYRYIRKPIGPIARPGLSGLSNPPGGDGYRHRAANASGEALTNQRRAATTA